MAKLKPEIDFEWGFNHVLICEVVVMRPQRITQAEWIDFWEKVDKLQKSGQL